MGLDCVRAGDVLQLVARSGARATSLAGRGGLRAGRAGGAGRADPARCRAALALSSGEYLTEERCADWALGRREDYSELCLGVLLRLARLRERAGVLGEAARCLRRVLALDPCHEEAAQALIRVEPEQSAAEAARVYQQVAAALARDLQLAPDQQTEALYRQLTAPETTPLPRTNLPTPLTSFVGRERELAALTGAASGTGSARARLVTLVGPGGCGKLGWRSSWVMNCSLPMARACGMSTWRRSAVPGVMCSPRTRWRR